MSLGVTLKSVVVAAVAVVMMTAAGEEEEEDVTDMTIAVMIAVEAVTGMTIAAEVATVTVTMTGGVMMTEAAINLSDRYKCNARGKACNDKGGA